MPCWADTPSGKQPRMDKRKSARKKVGFERFEDYIKLHHLKALMRKFGKHRPTDDAPLDGTLSPGRHVKREKGNVTLGEFKEMLESLGIDTTQWDAQMDLLFAKVDTSADGMVDCNEFINFMLLHYEEKDKIVRQNGVIFVNEPKIVQLPQIKQDAIQCLIPLKDPTRYVVLSREGMLFQYDNALHLEKTFRINRGMPDSRGSRKRCFKVWCSGLVFMADCSKVVVSSTARDLKFFDISTTQGFVEEYHLYALQDIPTCLDYWYDPKAPFEKSLLLLGTDSGSIHLLYFLKPTEQLFENVAKRNDDVQEIFMQDICLHQDYVCHKKLTNIHTEILRKVQYLPEKNLVISSSGSSRTSLVITDVNGHRKGYTFRRRKGVECFDYSQSLNVIVTGGIDHKVLVWNPYIEDSPIAFFVGHTMVVVGVTINDEMQHVYSFSKDGVVKVWDLKEYKCLQTVTIHFPNLLNGPPEADFASSAMTLGDHQTLTIGFGDHMAQLKIGRDEAKERNIPVTHSAQLCCAIYNSFFKQVATASDDSTVSVWDLESGEKSYLISEAHGTEEITCMVFSTTGRKLYTGARNGTIKVWNFQNGHNIHHCECIAEAEVTGLVSLGKKKGFVTAGWSRRLTVYDDSDSEDLFLKAEMDWRGGNLHQDDILAMDICLPGLLATASFDGEILVWSAETQMLLFRLRNGQPSQVSQRLKNLLAQNEVRPVRSGASSKLSIHNSRPNSRHIHHRRPPQGFVQSPVDALLFLKSRIYEGMNESAVLVSSEAGHIHLWSIYDAEHYRGHFYACRSPSEEDSVLALTSDANNSILVLGDTSGYIYVWDITDHCIDQTECNYPPPLVESWQGHESAVVSIELSEVSYGTFIISASTDWTARLWTLGGHFVGTFGQSKKWNLRDPSSFMHPKNPWSDIQDSKVNVGNADNRAIDDRESHEDVPDIAAFEQSENPNSGPQINYEIQSKEEDNKHMLSSVDSQITGDNDNCEDRSESFLPPIQRNNSLTNMRKRDTPPSPSSLVLSDLMPSDRCSSLSQLDVEEHPQSQISPYEEPFRYTISAPSVLGKHVENSISRITRSRQIRRQRFGNLQSSNLMHLGGQCSPFRNLATPETDEVEFPSNLPISQRMEKLGFTCISEADLRNVMLSQFTIDFKWEEKKSREGHTSRGRSSAYLPSV